MKAQLKRFFPVVLVFLLLVALVACDLTGTPSGGSQKQTGDGKPTAEKTEDVGTPTLDDKETELPEDAEPQNREEVFIELISKESYFMDSFDVETEMTLAQFATVMLNAPSFEETLADGKWYVDGQPANADTVIKKGSHLIYEQNGYVSEKPVMDPDDGYVCASFVNAGTFLNMEKHLVKAKGDALTLKTFVSILRMQKLFDQSYEQSLRRGSWRINNEPATENMLIEDGNVISYHPESEEDTPAYTETKPEDPSADIPDYTTEPEYSKDPEENTKEPSVEDGEDNTDTRPSDSTATGKPVDPEASKDPVEDTSIPEKPTEPEEEPTHPEDSKDPVEDTTYPEVPTDPEEEPTYPEDSKDPIEDTTYPEVPTDPEEEPTTPPEIIDPMPEEYFVIEVLIVDSDGNREYILFEMTKPLKLHQFVDKYLYEYLEIGFKESLERGSWQVDGMDVESGSMLLDNKYYSIVYHFDIPDDGEHEHEWNEFHECIICGIPCSHDSMVDFTCPDCGFTTGGGELIVTMTFDFYIDGEYYTTEMYTTMRDDVVTLRQLFEEIIAESAPWEDLAAYYAFSVDGKDVDGEFKMPATQDYWQISLTVREDLPEMPPEYQPFYVEAFWYLPSADGTLYPKEIFAYVDREMTLAQLLDEMYIDVSDYSTQKCYLNNVYISDIYSYTLSDEDAVDGTCYLVIVPKKMKLSFSIELVNKLGEETVSQIYSFNHPIMWKPWLADVLDGIDWNAVDINIVGDSYDMMGDIICMKDKTVEIIWREESVFIDLVTEDGTVLPREIVVVGAKPTLAQFAEEYLGISDFDAYYFFDPNAQFASSEPAEMTHYYELVVIPKSIVPEEIKIEYEILLREKSEPHVGTLVLNAPEKLHEAFRNDDSIDFLFPDVFEASGYDIYIDGALFENVDGKGTYYILIYKDIKLVMKPSYSVWVYMPEADGAELLKLENDRIAFSEIAERLHVNFDHYIWRINDSTVMDASMMLGDFYSTSGTWELSLIPKTVFFEIGFFDVNGNYLDEFWSESFTYSATAEEIYQLIANCGYDPTAYQIFYIDPMSGEKIELTASDVLVYPEYWDGGEISYRIEVQEIAVPITICGFDSRWEIYQVETVFRSGITVWELMDSKWLDRENIKQITFENADGEILLLSLESVLSEAGTLRIEYLVYYNVRVWIYQPMYGEINEYIRISDLSVTFGELVSRFDVDFDSFKWSFGGIRVTDANALLSDYANAEYTEFELCGEQLQMEINIELYESEYSYDVPWFTWNSEKEFGAQRTAESIAAYCGIEFSDYTWYLYRESGELLREITDPHEVLEYDMETEWSYTYYRLVLLPKHFSVTVEIYINDYYAETLTVGMYEGPVTVETVAQEVGCSWDMVVNAFVDRRYSEGEDAYLDTVLDGPCKLSLNIYDADK